MAISAAADGADRSALRNTEASRNHADCLGSISLALLRVEYLRYDHGRDARWLLMRPWVWIPRVFQISWTLLGLLLSLLLRGNSKDSKVQRNLARTLLRTLTNLGPCFIKVGQALSTRPDLIRRDWLDELTRLQDDLPSFDHGIALETIEEELGAPIDELFEEFPDSPIAAASLGQVYKARVGPHDWVAVKVQRPNLTFILRRDMVLIRSLSVLVAPVLPLNLGFGLGEIIDEFGSSLFEEIDYCCEAINCKHFSRLFAGNPAVTIPDVFDELSSRRVLTTSWIQGTKLRDPQELKSQRLDPAALIRTGVISGLQQLLEFGYFHADPHPGNLFALPGRSGDLGHVAYVDFGMMDSISDLDRLTLTGAVVHLINHEFDAVASDFQRLGFLAPDADLTPIIPALADVFGGSLGDSVGSFNFKAITDRFSELMYDYPFRVPARFALIIRAVVSQEGLALRLDRDFRIIAVAYPYVAKRLLAGDTREMREKLLEVIFDQQGNLRIERLENLLDVVSNESSLQSSSDLLPVAGAGLRLLLSKDGGDLRQRLLLTLIKDDRLNISDLKELTSLMRKTFGPRQIAEGVMQRLNPLAA